MRRYLLPALILSLSPRPALAAIMPSGRNLTNGELFLSAASLVFAVAVIIAGTWLRGRQVVSGDISFKIIGLGVVVGAGLFLVSAGYSQEQTAPIFGLLGTALGFIFGRIAAGDKETPPPTP